MFMRLPRHFPIFVEGDRLLPFLIVVCTKLCTKFPNDETARPKGGTATKTWFTPTVIFALLALALLTFVPTKGQAPARTQVPASQTLPVCATPRFQAIQLHPNAGSEWSGLVDTATGCVWEPVLNCVD